MIKALDMGRFTRFFADRTMPLAGPSVREGLPVIALPDRACALVRRERLPQRATWFSGTIATGKTNNPARLAFQGHPNPGLFALGADK